MTSPNELLRQIEKQPFGPIVIFNSEDVLEVPFYKIFNVYNLRPLSIYLPRGKIHHERSLQKWDTISSCWRFKIPWFWEHSDWNGDLYAYEFKVSAYYRWIPLVMHCPEFIGY